MIETDKGHQHRAERFTRRRNVVGLSPDPYWYKHAIVYEVHVRAFCDSNGDGIGDLVGLTSKLDYLQDLGVTALWLLPFYPSPLRDGGYDIADYTSINPAYGTMADFKELLHQAHKRGIRIITELVINHTSSEHAWFQRARRAKPGTPERDFYVWSDTPERYTQARIIFKDFEQSNWAWDPVAHAYYWHRFYSHQPDLNFDNPAVHDAVIEAMDFWLGLGVDGLRLDAVPYLYEREGTNCENLDETHAFLKKLRAHVDGKYRDRMLLAEANQWPTDAAAYFGDGDECHMNFHFPLMPRMFMAVQMEDRFPIVDILRQTPHIPEHAAWATFLRNHDELTLEMVTDEERDYMYRVYTEDPVARLNLGIRRRLAPLLRSRRKIELMTTLLFALPGTPVLYYGDEIGMGDNIYLGDRDGVRTPMQWSSDRNAGFSRANPHQLYLPVIIDPEYHYESVNVEAQQGNPSSLLWWTKRLIAMRKEHKVFGAGTMEFLEPDNPRILAFVRRHGDDQVLVVANLSRYPQYVELDLSAHHGRTPIEMIGRTRFPTITDRPYGLSFGPHMFLWFQLEAPEPVGAGRPMLIAEGSWTAITNEPAPLARILAEHASSRRWFRGKARVRTGAALIDQFELPTTYGRCLGLIFQVTYADGEPEQYLIPVGFTQGEPAVELEHRFPHAVIASVEVSGFEPAAGASGSMPAMPAVGGGAVGAGVVGTLTRGVLYDALATGEAASALLHGVRERATWPGLHGRLECSSGAALHERLGDLDLSPRVAELEQTNTTVPFGDRVLMKVLRQVEHGPNTELEIGQHLDGRPEAGTPRVLGAVTYRPDEGEPATIGIVHEFVPNQGTAWDLLVGELELSLLRALAEGVELPPAPAAHVVDLVAVEPPAVVTELIGSHLRHARRLGARTATVHLALAASTEPPFIPERFTIMYQQSLFQSARASAVRTFDTLARRLTTLPVEVQEDARAILAARGAVENRLRALLARPLDALRIRTHGDLHLGQILRTGDDFVIIDFEGEPARRLSERRYKRYALRDVAGMLRSFAYATESCLRSGRLRAQDQSRLRPWARTWLAWMSAAYLGAYLEAIGDLVPPRREDRIVLLEFYMIEKCVYEVGYELNNRPGWLPIPVRGLLELVGETKEPAR
ncbi:MAG TPA: maltose alpha-D-glucosyltransferase [Kofleriaceae bacterium]|nr:maltose alpha-D-glucosyltransferase [Kofleriaceae bacterium]